MSHLVHFTGNRSPSLSDTIKVDGAAFDLTGSTVKFKARLATSATLKIDAAAAIQAPPGVDGKVRYDWAAADVVVGEDEGFYTAWWEVTLPNAKTQDTDEFVIWMRPHAVLAGALCTVDQVREYLQKPGADRNQDAIIQALALAASKAIMVHTGREFAPATADAVRRLAYRPNRQGLMSLSPFELRDADGAPFYVKLHPEESPTTLVLDQDYVLEPTANADGVWGALRFSNRLQISSSRLRDFGHAQLEIRGAWGWPSVPYDVEQAAIITTGIWMRRDVQAFNTAFNLEAGFLERPEALPSAVRSMLEPWRRSSLY